MVTLHTALVERGDAPHRHQAFARGALATALLAALALAGCSDGRSDAAVATSSAPRGSAGELTAAAGAPTSAPTATEPSATTEYVPPTTESKIPIPPGQLVAVPQQNREDPAKGQFQVQMVNDTEERFEVSSVQFLWDGYTTPVTPRDSTIVAGQIIDFPVAFPGATCVGDGLVDTMPSLDDAVVLLGLDDGSVREVPVIDRWHLARRLYLEDCQRQFIAASVTIVWADLHEELFEGRPVTAGVLRLTRGTGTGTITVDTISGTVPYSFEPVDTAADEPVIVLAAADDVGEVPIRFTESRCDPHALAEVKQPHKFVAQVDLGDGVLRPFIVIPDQRDWVPMRNTADEACVVTGQVVFVGEETPAP